MKKRNILVTLECFVHKNGKYLMLHRNTDKRIMPGVWMAPGGKREFNEGLFEATRREIFEETGLTIKNLRVKVAANAYMKDIDQEVFFHFVFADYAGGTVKKSPEDGELKWLTPQEIGKLDNLIAEIRNILPQLFTSTGILSYTAVYEKGNILTSFHLEDSK
ncbi:MAG: NUDIX domain-containing protein [Candidatus Roizmanbacteria bacterium]|nr:NUDIX domain-containing protein [Candidatus Roizmanbacteria bacterium]